MFGDGVCLYMYFTKRLCLAACTKEQPNWPVKGAAPPCLSPSSSSPLQRNGCHSAKLTAVIIGQQSILRFKLPLPPS